MRHRCSRSSASTRPASRLRRRSTRCTARSHRCAARSRRLDNPAVPFTFSALTQLPDVVLIRTTRHGDDRGWFVETYKKSALAAAGINAEFRQDNHSFSARPGTLRGLHFQIAPAAQGKLVRVLSGEVFDVVVDLRDGATFGRWISMQLNAAEPTMLWVPEGFAHGFQAIAPDTAVTY